LKDTCCALHNSTPVTPQKGWRSVDLGLASNISDFSKVSRLEAVKFAD